MRACRFGVLATILVSSGSSPGVPPSDSRINVVPGQAVLSHWSYRATTQGRLYWRNAPAEKADADLSARPFWFDEEAGAILVFANHDLGQAVLDLHEQRAIAFEELVGNDARLATAYARAIERRLVAAGPSDQRWTVVRNAMLAPADFIKPYAGWGHELFGDVDGDGLVSVEDMDRLRRSLLPDGLQDGDASRMDLTVIGVVAQYCPPECPPRLAAAGQTATINCDGCNGSPPGDEPPPPPTCPPWGRDLCNDGSSCTEDFCCDAVNVCDHRCTCMTISPGGGGL